MLSFTNKAADISSSDKVMFNSNNTNSNAALKSTVVSKSEAVESNNVAKQPEPEVLQQALDVINRAAVIEQRSLSFSVDELSGRSIIKVVDQTTDQLIRQIPSEDLLKVAQDIKRLQDEMGQSLGLLIDRKV
ncbi:flagellar protein FlaG [Arsukibacterium sp.]|uniref:flagellar protein FlaG n=1 Tax=Arsukibacterium sp. TaxID=1977258 RepID=UPI002FDA0498